MTIEKIRCVKAEMTNEEYKACRRAYMRAWSKENKDNRREYNAMYYLENRDKHLEYARIYRQSEQGKNVLRNDKHKRRSIIENAGNFTLEEWNEILERYNNTCLKCGRNDVKLTIDHIKPLSKGGNNTINNIQPLCAPCNKHKYTKVIDYRSISDIFKYQVVLNRAEILTGKDKIYVF